jgi:hypothetical protein
VAAGFVPGVGGSFELEGGVLDVEVASQAGLELVQQPGGVAVVKARVVDDDVRRQGGEVGGHGPGVQVVQAQDVLGGQQVSADLLQVRSRGRGLQQDPAGVAQQLPGGLDHQASDDQGRDGIGAGEPGSQDDDARDDSADESVQVGQDVPERAPHVQAGAVRAGQRPGRGDVNRDAGGSDGDDRTAGHAGRVYQAADRLDGDNPSDNQQRDAVAGRGQDLGALPAKGPCSGGRAGSQPDRPQCPGDRADVGEHVPGVRQQGQRPGQHRGDHLAGHERGQQAQRDQQVPLIGSRVRVPVLGVTTTGAIGARHDRLVASLPG